jgi:anti-sigma factor RsiW
MECRQVVEVVTAYLDGAMPAPDRRRLEAHLTACPHCTVYVEQIRSTIALTGAIAPESLSDEALADLAGVFRAWSAEGA